MSVAAQVIDDIPRGLLEVVDQNRRGIWQQFGWGIECVIVPLAAEIRALRMFPLKNMRWCCSRTFPMTNGVVRCGASVGGPTEASVPLM
jgi:hypothetical protein